VSAKAPIAPEWPEARPTALAAGLFFAGLSVLWPPFAAATGAVEALAFLTLLPALRGGSGAGVGASARRGALGAVAIAWILFLAVGAIPPAARAGALAVATNGLAVVLRGRPGGAV
jgi:hypothetical protein